MRDYAATARPQESDCTTARGKLRYLPMDVLCDVRYWHGICLRGWHAMPGTDIANGTRSLTRLHQPPSAAGKTLLAAYAKGFRAIDLHRWLRGARY